MLIYEDVRMMWVDYVRLGFERLDQDKVLELIYDCMILYERAGEDLPRTEPILEILDVLKHEKEVSRCLSEEIDELTGKLDKAEEEIAELRRQLSATRARP